MSTACVPLVAQLLLFNFLAKQLKGNLFALINERGFSTALHIVHSEHTNNTVIHWVADMTSIFFFLEFNFSKTWANSDHCLLVCIENDVKRDRCTKKKRWISDTLSVCGCVLVRVYSSVGKLLRRLRVYITFSV